MNFIIKGGSPNAKIRIENQVERDGIITFDVKMNFDTPEIPEQFTVRFDFPSIDIYSVWSPSVRYDRFVGVTWKKKTSTSRLASWMPLHALVSADGKNRLTIAISDAKTPTAIATGVHEHNAEFECDIRFFTIKVAPLTEYTATVRLDLRDVPYYDTLYAVTEWWENECGYKPAYVPDSAKQPVNSLWYSYHQELFADQIVKECALSKPLGMDTVIVDDGWQTHDQGRGYITCGDWEMAPNKFPDMRKFVEDIHALDMKVMLWFSVPFIGLEAKQFDHFKDMLISTPDFTKSVYVFDPRYKEVRDYLIDKYATAVREWNLDGLKLDFIDSFALSEGKSLEDDARRDYQSLEDAIDVLMIDITNALREVNPEILIEFRQSYVGPAIRKYGNMLRVADCPNDCFRNRHNIINLRYTSGKTAIHSDMVMWHYDDDVESAALQLVSIMYSVPQISVRVERLCDEHKRMLDFYLHFWKENRDTLIDGKLIAANPESGYSIACSYKDGKAIFTSYTDIIIDCRNYNEIIALNSSRSKTLVIRGANAKGYKVLNCMGETVSEGVINGELCEIAVPLAGMICIK